MNCKDAEQLKELVNAYEQMISKGIFDTNNCLLPKIVPHLLTHIPDLLD